MIMSYVECMRELSELRNRRRSRVLAACVAARHHAGMESRETRIRRRLGVEIALLRERLGYPKQPDLAAAAQIGKRTVVAVEGGDKVSSKTLGKIEATLGLEPGIFEAYLAEEIKALPMPVSRSQPSRQSEEWILAASYADIGAEADRIQGEEGAVAARLWVDEAMKVKQAHAARQQSETRSATERDAG